ncbi:MAG: hypothetical protein LBM39_02015 [Candidatus Methanoplasma sp.]|jgi:hypothetical protein|nr:hypothetical protein [Candidatus Methanoplasma sp.]
MKLHIENGKGTDFWAEDLPEGLSLVRACDKLTMAVAIAAFIFSIIFIIYRSTNGELPLQDAIPWLSVPFFICGIIYYLRTRFWILIILAAAAVVLWFIDIPMPLLILVLLLTIGAPGVVAIVEAIQRWMFYRVLHTIEYVNVKKKLSFTEKFIVFLFNVPVDIDTRNITMDYGLRRSGIPWKEMLGTISLGLMVGMFIWIYISMNPVIMDLSGELDLSSIGSAPFLIFTIILYIPIIVLPWSIFKSLNVRVETHYRDFKVYNGVRSTIQTMVVPIVAAFILVFTALASSDYLAVLFYIGMSVVMVTAIVGLAAAFYYVGFETVLINDIVSKWKKFRPVPIFIGLKAKEQKKEEVPGTPNRDTEDFGKLVLPDNNNK